ncbi:class I SAM-dependent methyltransferase [Oscillatoria sp. CS-180]|uniref:class I SAM-dependent methyltransferase n=1 Tax=Oscillatoria sp. CS-180 TaxID=3021720 RepID=UPI00232A8C9D|nr:class I SAM-dependent methyltransferase [Oscillatoria sp. CS-180]MDB9528921.1 class I SAM-dependent methyltransferase [Oscillatoria sp. CS-180]
MTATGTQKPAWAGDDLLSKVVNQLIRTKPLYALMKHQARQVLIKTAEKNGIPWRQTCAELEASDIQSLLPVLDNAAITYPDYYQVPFHAYDAGNLCWQAAFEAASATYSMALRVWPDEALTWQAAHERLRSTFHAVLKTYITHPVHNVLDMGCSVGLSTLTLHRFFQQQTDTVQTIGLDLSPYMLTVAQQRDSHNEIAQWLHANAESTGLPANTFDVITLQFVTHELPRTATRAIFQEALRLLRPGGTLAIADNNPKSAVIQKLPPVLFTLMKSTEPWSDDYYTFDIEAALADIGYQHITTAETDPRHRAILAQKPKA